MKQKKGSKCPCSYFFFSDKNKIYTKSNLGRNKKTDSLTRFLPLCTLVYNKRLASLSSKASSKGLSSRRRGGTQAPSSGGGWRPPSFHILTAKCEGQNVSGKMFTNGFDSCPRYQISHLSSPILCSLCTAL